MKSFSVALFLVALLSAPAFGQSTVGACTVDIVYPQGTLQLSSGECDTGWICQPGGCVGSTDMIEPITLALADPPLAYEGLLRSSDRVTIRTARPDFTSVQEWRGTLGWNGYLFVLEISDRLFAQGFDD